MHPDKLMAAIERRRQAARAAYWVEPLPNEPFSAEVVSQRELAVARKALGARDAERAEKAAAKERKAEAEAERIAAREAREAERIAARERKAAEKIAAREAREAEKIAARERKAADLKQRKAEREAREAEKIAARERKAADLKQRKAEREARPDGRTNRQRTEADRAASLRHRRYSDAEIQRALEVGGGRYRRAAEFLGATPASVRERVRRTPELRAAADRFQTEAEARRLAAVVVALRAASGQPAEAARQLGVSRATLRRWMDRT